jgi:hypothetical protein
MTHPYPIREIARQAGVSEATVDRVLNHPAGGVLTRSQRMSWYYSPVATGRSGSATQLDQEPT